MMFEISRRPSSPVSAVIVTQPVISVPALVMNCLVPSITHSPPSSLAVVRVAPASVPASGSVRPKAPSRSPLASSGIHSSLCSADPYIQIGLVPRDVWAATVIATEASIRASSSIASAYESVSPPPPP